MRTLITLLIILLSFAVFPFEAEELFREGVDSYQDGNYNEAVEKWEELISKGYRDARIYYNLGNAYFRAGSYGRAVLSLERAARLSPNDGKIRDNLKFVRARLKDNFDDGTLSASIAFRILKGLENLLPLSTLRAAVTGLNYLLCLSIALLLLLRSNHVRSAATFGGTIIFALLLIFSILFGLNYYKSHVVEGGVIVSLSVTGRSSPRQDATVLFVVHEGTKVRIWDEVGDWTRVSLPNGLTGFILKDTLEKI